MTNKQVSVTGAWALLTIALLATPRASGQLLHFSLSGTLDSPNGVYPLLAPQFNVSFDLPSDPRNLVSEPLAVALYATVAYSNGGITRQDAHAFMEFNSSAPGWGGGIYIFFQRTNWFPNGFALDLAIDAPVIYSGTIAEPHFSVGTFDLSGALQHVAAQGAGGPGDSPISDGVLTISEVPEPGALVLALLAVALVFCRLLRRSARA